MKATTKRISIVVIALVLGYVLGAFIGIPATSGSFGAGDISKVTKYQKNLVSPQANAFQEKILNDSTERAKAAVSLVFISSRMQEFSNLVDFAARVSDGKTELAEAVAKLQTVKRISDNAAKAGKEAKAAFVDIINKEGKNSAAAYEAAYKNLSVAYLMIDRQMEVGKEYVLAVDSYLAGKSMDDNKELALSRELWADYLLGNAKMDNNSTEMAYWKGQKSIMQKDDFNAAFSQVDSSLRKAVMFDSYCGISELGKAMNSEFGNNINNEFGNNINNEFGNNINNEFGNNINNEFGNNINNEFGNNMNNELISNIGEFEHFINSELGQSTNMELSNGWNYYNEFSFDSNSELGIDVLSEFNDFMNSELGMPSYSEFEKAGI